MWRGQGLYFARVPPICRGLAHTCEAVRSSTHPLGRYHASNSHPFGILQHLHHRNGRHLDWPRWDQNTHYVVSPLARRIGIRYQSLGNHHQLWPWSHHPCPTQGYAAVSNSQSGHGIYPLRFWEHTDCFLYHKVGVNHKPGGCGSTPYSNDSLNAVLPQPLFILSYSTGKSHGEKCLPLLIISWHCLYWQHFVNPTTATNHLLYLPPTTTYTFMRDIHAEQKVKVKQVPHKIRDIRVFTGSGTTSAPPFQSTLLSKIHTFLESRY